MATSASDHGSDAILPRRYVSRQKLCLRGTTDYWINDALVRPFFVISKAITEGLAATLLDSVPAQPTADQLAADSLLHRFIVIFDREGSHHNLLSQLWEHRVGIITYRKNVTARKAAPVPVIEVRRLTDSGHQTAIITTARNLASPAIAGCKFSRWCQENYFGYMMEHYDIDGLVQYGSEEIPGATRIVNPAWRELDRQIARLHNRLRRHQATLGAAAPPDPDDGQKTAQRAALRASRRATPTPATTLSISSFSPPAHPQNAANHFPTGSGCLRLAFELAEKCRVGQNLCTAILRANSSGT